MATGLQGTAELERESLRGSLRERDRARERERGEGELVRERERERERQTDRQTEGGRERESSVLKRETEHLWLQQPIHGMTRAGRGGGDCRAGDDEERNAGVLRNANCCDAAQSFKSPVILNFGKVRGSSSACPLIALRQ